MLKTNSVGRLFCKMQMVTVAHKKLWLQVPSLLRDHPLMCLHFKLEAVLLPFLGCLSSHHRGSLGLLDCTGKKRDLLKPVWGRTLQENLKQGVGCSGNAGGCWGNNAASLTQKSLTRKYQGKEATELITPKYLDKVEVYCYTFSSRSLSQLLGPLNTSL